ncbi:MAG: TRAP transporter large permease [Sagittula sp.]|uniref:TRAP transporter large permease n=1 Tax=Sagittula sp. TaxID=2038081 RepID=UPI0040581C44
MDQTRHNAPGEAMPHARPERRRGADTASAVAAISAVLGSLSVVVIFVVILYEVVSRYVFGAPTGWATEYSTYALTALAYLGAAYAQAEGSNVRIDVLISRAGTGPARTVALVGTWLALGFIFVALWQCVLYAWGEWSFGGRSIVLGVPRWIPLVPVIAGLAALLIALVSDLARLDPPRRRWLPAAATAGLFVLLAALCFLGRQPVAVTELRLDAGAAATMLAILLLCLVWSGPRMAALTALSVGLAAAVLAFAAGLPFGWAAALLCLVLLVFLLSGMPVVFALGITCLLGFYLLLPITVGAEIAARAVSSLSSFSFTAVPMYVLMGALLLKSGIASELFAAMLLWLGRVPGGLAHAGIGASTVFAAVSGSSLATAATIGTIACPAMTDRGYSRRLAYGAIAAGGTLGILIPPSIPLIVYGTTVGESVSRLFFAGFLPGVLLALGFMCVAFAWARLRPAAAPHTDPADVGFGRAEAAWKIAPLAGIIAFVLVTIYGGIVTPTEAGALGALAALVLCAARGKVSVPMLGTVLAETVRVCAFLLLIVWGASLLTYLFEYLQISERIIRSVEGAGLSAAMVMALICLVYIVLGMFVDPISMMLVTLPVTYPLVTGLGYDGVWFGIVLVILVEIGLVTPPLGMNIFILQGIEKGVTTNEIAAGVLPFILVMIGFVVLLFMFPQIALVVPGLMR